MLRFKKRGELIWSIAFIMSVLAYSLSLSQVAFSDSFHHPNYGIVALLLGPVFMLAGGASLTWLANPVLWYAWFKFRDTKRSLQASLIATLISMSFLLFSEIREVGIGVTTDMHTTGINGTITGYGWGYVFWLSSSFILLVGNYYRYYREGLKNEMK